MAKWYAGFQIDFAHRRANFQLHLHLRDPGHKHWDTTEAEL